MSVDGGGEGGEEPMRGMGILGAVANCNKRLGGLRVHEGNLLLWRWYKQETKQTFPPRGQYLLHSKSNV